MVYMVAELSANLLVDAAAGDETHSQAMICPIISVSKYTLIVPLLLVHVDIPLYFKRSWLN
jgi:hypothetical protein